MHPLIVTLLLSPSGPYAHPLILTFQLATPDPSPPQVEREETQLPASWEKGNLGKGFGESVSELLESTDLLYLDQTCVDGIPDEVVSKPEVFALWGIGIGVSKCKSRCVIHVESEWRRVLKTKFQEEVTDECKVRRSMSSLSILRLTSRSINGQVFLRTVVDCPT